MSKNKAWIFEGFLRQVFPLLSSLNIFEIVFLVFFDFFINYHMKLSEKYKKCPQLDIYYIYIFRFVSFREKKNSFHVKMTQKSIFFYFQPLIFGRKE